MQTISSVFPGQTRLVLFDMDGVLVLSEPLHYQAWFVLAEELGFSLAGFMSFEASIGISDSIVVRDLIHERKLPFTHEKLLSRKREIFLELVGKEGIQAPAGRADFLAHCRARYRLGLVSSSSRRSVDGVLRATGLEDFFEFCVTGDDIREPKPAPEPYLLALAKAGVATVEAVAIEDSPSGIASATAAGIKVLPFKTDFVALVQEQAEPRRA